MSEPSATYETLLRDIAQRDDRVIVLTAENRAAIRGLPAALGARLIDTGITEQTMVGMGAGLALRGRVPVMHALAAFLTMRPFEFIRTDIGIPRLNAKLVGSVAGVLSEANGPTHQAVEDIALMRAVPHMGIFCPADTDELLLGLPVVLAHDGPFYIRYIDRPAVYPHTTPFAIGRAEVPVRGTDVAIITYGAMVRESLAAACVLAGEGISARVVNLRTVQPVDEVEILAAARATKLLVTVEDHFITGGLYSLVCERLVARRIRAPVLPISLERSWFTPALLPDVLERAGLTPSRIATRIRHALVASRLAAEGHDHAQYH